MKEEEIKQSLRELLHMGLIRRTTPALDGRMRYEVVLADDVEYEAKKERLRRLEHDPETSKLFEEVVGEFDVLEWMHGFEQQASIAMVALSHLQTKREREDALMLATSMLYTAVGGVSILTGRLPSQTVEWLAAKALDDGWGHVIGGGD